MEAKRFSNFFQEKVLNKASQIYANTRTREMGFKAGHFAGTGRALLHQTFPKRCSEPVAWPAFAPDLTPSDFQLGDMLQERVYS